MAQFPFGRFARRATLSSIGVGVLIALVAVGSALVSLWTQPDVANNDFSQAAPIPLGVLGDSDSHSYADHYSFAKGSWVRGGKNRAVSQQWPEVLARLRPERIDLGAWGLRGTTRKLARLREWMGIETRSPRKEDYEYNLAFSGATCRDLMDGPMRQTPRLVQSMDRDAQRWSHGVVVIRMGVNDFGHAEELDRLARDRNDVAVRNRIEECLANVRRSVAFIHQKHPQVHVVLVGIFDNAHWASYVDRWQSPSALANIAAGLDLFDNGLRSDAAADPHRLTFFDDRAWFRSHWGTRDENGRPAYRAPRLGGLQVANSAGDSLANATLADGHAGTAWNVLWAQSLIAQIDQAFALNIGAPDGAELDRYLTTLASSAVRTDWP